MKSRIQKLPLRSADELLAIKPSKATALIVAECQGDRADMTRRVALGWIQGSEGFTHLREAAAQFEDTAYLAAADKSVEHRDGADQSCYLKNGRHRSVSWAVRTIPINLVKCWSRFEDAISTPAAEPGMQKETETTIHPAPTTASAPTESIGKPSPKSSNTVTEPAIEAPDAAKSVENEPSFRPIAELAVDRKLAFLGNCAAPDSKFITDGRMLLLKSACDLKLAAAKTVDVGRYGPASPVPENVMQRLFDNSVENAKTHAQIKGYVLAKEMNKLDDNEPLACAASTRNAVVVLNGHRLRFILDRLDAESVMIASGKDCDRKPVVFYKAGNPVAVLMLTIAPDAQKLFSRMLADKVPTQSPQPATQSTPELKTVKRPYSRLTTPVADPTPIPTPVLNFDFTI